MDKKISALEEMSEQELDQVTGGDDWLDAIARMDFYIPDWAFSQVSQAQGGGSCSVQDVMNDRC